MTAANLDLVVQARRAVAGVYGTLRPCSLGVRAGRIVAVEAYGAGLDAAEIVDLAADEVLLPGLVRRTWLRGRPAYGEPAGRPPAGDEQGEPAGRLIRRAES